MYLSKFQKEIVRKISSEEIKTVFDFLSSFNLVISGVAPRKSEVTNGIEKVEGEADFFLDNIQYKIIDRNDAYSKLIDFRKVINLLNKEGLIDISLSSNLNFGHVGYSTYPKYVINLLWASRNTFIIIYNEMKIFGKDYLTPQERTQRRQLWVPIIVAVATVLLSSVINYFIYTKEREVFIKNINAFQDTVKVKLIDDKDSLRIENN